MPYLEIRLYGEHVGTLEQRGAGSIFEPSDEWRFARFQPLLGLSWLQDTSPRRAAVGLPVWFEALLPDRGSPLRGRLAQSAGVFEEDSFGLLRAMGSDLPGAVRVRGEGERPAEDAAPTEPPSPLKGPLHFSLAGAQLKFSLVLRDHKLALPVHGEEGSYIAKIPGERFPMLPTIEATTLDWAARCGHETPEHDLRELRTIGELAHLELFPGELCLVLRRYDRTEAGPVHQEDLCQVFSIPPTSRYGESTPGIDYAGLARFLRDGVGEEGAQEFTRRLAFALASGNSDAHLQNWSVVLPREGALRLAPAYDQVSVIALSGWGWDRTLGPTLALPLGGMKRMSEIDRAAVDRYARAAGDPSLAGIFLSALERSRRAWAEIEERALPAHRAAIAAQWANVPLLAKLSG